MDYTQFIAARKNITVAKGAMPDPTPTSDMFTITSKRFDPLTGAETEPVVETIFLSQLASEKAMLERQVAEIRGRIDAIDQVIEDLSSLDGE